MSKNLVIVESPAKAKTIEGYLGKDFIVKSSFGHVRDLSTKDLGIDVANGFKPLYEIMPDKQKMIRELKKMADGAETIWLATDEDREGEAISWHLSEVLGLDPERTRRIVFHEITKTAITEAIAKPRKIDQNLVNAQQARRVLDRLVGFELSPILWKKVKPSLSAGRVQSVAVRLIVEREEEIRAFKSSFSFKVTGIFDVNNEFGTAKIKAELPKRFATSDEAYKFLEICSKANFSVADIETKPGKRTPAPPFTTSTLQQEASRKLGFSVSRTMTIAQQLYEAGKITYMRTDSVHLSQMALGMARDTIIEQFGKEYHKSRQYATKSKGAQEAHEAIRPTSSNQSSIDGDAAQRKLYELIWKRTIASQMADAILEKTNIYINISTAKEQFIAAGEVIKFDGFLKVYMESTDDDTENEEGILPPLKKGEILGMDEIQAVQKYSQSPPRYNEASLVKKMEELGIGRPSTYAPTISTIQKREYVLKEDRDGFSRDIEQLVLKAGKIKSVIKAEKYGFEKNKLFPTDVGELVTRFLLQYFTDIMDYNFTANVEKEFDEIAEGLKKWNSIISDFYGPFHKKVTETLESKEKAKGEKLLGVDPASGKNVFVKIGRFGSMAQIGNSDSEEKPRFAGLRKGQSIENISLEEALKLFEFPRPIGEFEGEELIVGIGRFGPYVLHNKKFFSLNKTQDPNTITEAEAITLIEEKRIGEANRMIREYAERPDVKVINGRFGPYISIGKENFKIPKGVVPASLTLQDCLDIAKNAPPSTKKKGAASRGKK
ncbi:MAG: type I DNA topoisomerase [Bacteroidales bacterium]|nr:type I DNA topoisomerase [Bacteroidales bacterium]